MKEFKDSISKWEENVKSRWKKTTMLQLELWDAEQKLSEAVKEAFESGVSVKELSNILCEPPQKISSRMKGVKRGERD